ncbi:MAG: protease pro-enzyme activation domain-containing protein, partial [Thermoplasmata archaeon]
MVISLFLLSYFSLLASGNDFVQISKGFDNRLLSGKYIGVPDLNMKIDISIALKLRNEQQLDNYLKELQDPNSPMFHHFISKENFQNIYSPTNEDFQMVFNYFKSRWQDVTPGPYNLAIFINN